MSFARERDMSGAAGAAYGGIAKMENVHSLDRRDRAVQQTMEDAARIPTLSHAEAGTLASAELECFLALLEELSVDDWSKPTACPMWNVRQMVAHITGAAAGYARWSEFKPAVLILNIT